jgi:hypothetical protein
MRIVLLPLFTLVLFSCGTNKAIYKSADFDQKVYQHKTVAILPVRMVQTGHIPKNLSMEDVKSSNEDGGYVFQEKLQTYILRNTHKHKKAQEVEFQSIQKTNGLLRKTNMSIQEMYDKQPEELARILGVDAVIMTTLNHNKNMSDGLAYGVIAAKTVVNVLSKNPILTPGVNASDVNINCSLYDAADSKLLWKTYREGGTDLPGNVDGLIKYYSNWIAKKLPYRS